MMPCRSNFRPLQISFHYIPASTEGDSFLRQAASLAFCFVGLQAAFLTWGVLQERIMTIPYGQNGDLSVAGEKFTNSQFLVFMNRISAFLVAGVIVFIKDQPRHRAPCYKYSFSSFSNIMSSWFQYEALKFVSFPTQVIAKSTKVIPGKTRSIHDDDDDHVYLPTNTTSCQQS